MNWSAYGAFLTFALVVVLVPGPDFAVVVGNTLAGGRRRGVWSSIGVATSNTIQGAAAVAGLGALIIKAHTVFQIIKWAGAIYLVVLGVLLLRSAVRGRYATAPTAAGGFRQGFLSNITNPK